MADVKWIKIAVNIFDNRKIRQIESMPDGDRTILTWFYLRSKSKKLKNGSLSFMIFEGFEITDDVIRTSVYPHTKYDTPAHIERLERVGLVKRLYDRILVYDFNARDRNSTDYIAWRKAVFQKDGYLCQDCGSNINLQAHHIKSWKNNEGSRFDVSNGLTLCFNCHLRRHGGNWKNG